MSFLLIVVLCTVAAEASVRLFWLWHRNLSVWEPENILYAYYPAMKTVNDASPAKDDAFYDILLLGGSVLHKGWGQVEEAFYKQLTEAGHRNVRIFNLAVPAQTSRDSWLKYAALESARFDLVVFYHGINETRANNTPPEFFRIDYSPYSWYEITNTLARYHGTSRFALPYTLDYLYHRLRQVLNADQYVPIHIPRADWVHYGNVSCSVVAFEQNLGTILDRAQHRGEQVLLMTFATYVPDNYSLQAFKERKLDYTWYKTPLEILGQPEHVLATLAIHNEIVRRMAARDEAILFVDQALLMDGKGRYFMDPCHLSPLGSSTFAEHLLTVLLPTLEGQQTASP